MERCTNQGGQCTALGLSESDPEVFARIATRPLAGAAEGELDPSHRCQSRQLAFDDVPHDVEIDAEVSVDESVPQPGDVSPGNLRMRSLQVGR